MFMQKNFQHYKKGIHCKVIFLLVSMHVNFVNMAQSWLNKNERRWGLGSITAHHFMSVWSDEHSNFICCKVHQFFSPLYKWKFCQFGPELAKKLKEEEGWNILLIIISFQFDDLRAFKVHCNAQKDLFRHADLDMDAWSPINLLFMCLFRSQAPVNYLKQELLQSFFVADMYISLQSSPGEWRHFIGSVWMNAWAFWDRFGKSPWIRWKMSKMRWVEKEFVSTSLNSI